MCREVCLGPSASGGPSALEDPLEAPNIFFPHKQVFGIFETVTSRRLKCTTPEVNPTPTTH